jgi:hypothetical protein
MANHFDSIDITDYFIPNLARNLNNHKKSNLQNLQHFHILDQYFDHTKILAIILLTDENFGTELNFDLGILRHS